MGSRWSYIVTHADKDHDTPWTEQDLTSDVDAIPVCTDIGGDQINTAVIELNCNLGHYIRDGRTGSGETGFPNKIDHNDRIRITIADGVTVGGYDQVFEVVRKVPIKSKTAGTKMRLECEGIERHLQKMKYIKRFFNATPAEALIDLVAYYQANKTTDMPSLTIGINKLPTFGLHHFDWGVNEESVFNRIVELVDMMGDASGVGGNLDFYDTRFTYSGANMTSMVINVFSSGSPSSGSEVTIDADTINTGDEIGGIEEAEGTLIGVWGDNEAGTLPIDYSRFKSRQLLLPTNGDSAYPIWTEGTYPANAIVQYLGSTYTTASETTATPGTSPWTVLTTVIHYGGSATPGTGIQYSPWTSGKATLWQNSGADPSDTSTFGAAMFDGNIIINDDETFRTWVDLRVTSSAPSTNWTYGNSASGYYDGMRVLVDSANPVAPFDGTDSNNRSFARNVAEYSAGDGDWKVKYDIFADSTLDGMMVAVFDEAKVYRNDTGSWTDITALDNGSDCFHNYDSIGQTTSVHIDPDTELEYAGTNNGSGVKVTYTWSPVETWAQNTFNARTFAGYYKSGAWMGIRFPFPKNDLNGITEDTGELYGGGSQGTTVKEPTGIDTQNMHLTHNGYRGFNTGSNDSLEALDYGPLSSIDFFMKLIFTDSGGTAFPSANFKMRAWLFDKSDHVVSQDFVLQFNNNYESVKLPLSGFQIYRGRRPRYDVSIVPLNDLIPPKGLAANEQFEWRHIVGFCVGTLDSYDNHGRYQAGLKDFGVQSAYTTSPRKIELWMDGLRFTKPLLYVTDDVSGTTLVKQPDFLQQPEVFVFDQLQNIGKSELQKAQFKKTEYDLENEIRTDIHYGDFFYFTDDEIVDDTDNSTDNNVKLVNKGTEYSFTKPIDSRGGGLRRMRASRRFV